MKRNKPFQFKIGVGSVIKGWSVSFRCIAAGFQRLTANVRACGHVSVRCLLRVFGAVVRVCCRDVGMASMTKGEVAVLEIDSEYGYGSAGAGGVIPPNAKLFFRVELLDFGK